MNSEDTGQEPSPEADPSTSGTATDAIEKAQGADSDAPEGSDQVGNGDAPEMD